MSAAVADCWLLLLQLLVPVGEPGSTEQPIMAAAAAAAAVDGAGGGGAAHVPPG